ncbi:MAG TPA: hypothetical protein VMG09_10860 [Bacteroidota bacterium]|nr:hypothetical protein [Bacteroidota bacterium]
MKTLIPIGAIVLGAALGYLFGTIQMYALMKNRKRQEAGKLTSGWAAMPYSFGRVSILILILAVIQLVCPIFFEDAISPWLVSAGVVVGYGLTLFQQMRWRSLYRG